MNRSLWLDQLSIIISSAAFIVTFFLLYFETYQFFYSLFAAAIAGVMFWMMYVLIRWIVIAIRQ